MSNVQKSTHVVLNCIVYIITLILFVSFSICHTLSLSNYLAYLIGVQSKKQKKVMSSVFIDDFINLYVYI